MNPDDKFEIIGCHAKDMVTRVLARHYLPDPRAYGRSWLTVLGHAKDSLWSVDLFRCESSFSKAIGCSSYRTWMIRPKVAHLDSYRWRSHCRGLYQLPVAA